jgi:hypothetical protein
LLRHLVLAEQGEVHRRVQPQPRARGLVDDAREIFVALRTHCEGGVVVAASHGLVTTMRVEHPQQHAPRELGWPVRALLRKTEYLFAGLDRPLHVAAREREDRHAPECCHHRATILDRLTQLAHPRAREVECGTGKPGREHEEHAQFVLDLQFESGSALTVGHAFDEHEGGS